MAKEQIPKVLLLVECLQRVFGFLAGQEAVRLLTFQSQFFEVSKEAVPQRFR